MYGSSMPCVRLRVRGAACVQHLGSGVHDYRAWICRHGCSAQARLLHLVHDELEGGGGLSFSSVEPRCRRCAAALPTSRSDIAPEDLERNLREDAVDDRDIALPDLPVHLHDRAVDRIGVAEATHEDVPRLPQPVDPSRRLHLHHRVEARLHQVDARGGGERDAHVAHQHRRHEDPGPGGATSRARLGARLEGPDRLVA
eukprot:7377805-Prymnesium_polylepis.1